jgi:hypothetical protein
VAETWDFPQPSDWGLWLENLSVSGGVALNGEEQNVFGENMRWRARGKIYFRNNDQVLRGRALFDKLQGRAGTIYVPTFDGKRVSWPVDTWGRTLHPGFTRRRELDGTEFEDPKIPTASELNVTVQTDAALRATSVEVTVTQGGVLLPGQYFSRLGNLYRIRSITSGPDSGGGYTLSILPPLRAALTASQVLNFTRPVCEMRQASDDQGIKELQSLRFAELTLEFIENF